MELGLELGQHLLLLLSGVASHHFNLTTLCCIASRYLLLSRHLFNPITLCCIIIVMYYLVG